MEEEIEYLLKKKKKLLDEALDPESEMPVHEERVKDKKVREI